MAVTKITYADKQSGDPHSAVEVNMVKTVVNNNADELQTALNQLAALGAANTILNGTTAPASATGKNGDFFLNTATSTLYGPKAGGTWPAGVSLKGATGSTGANGTDGKTILSGSGAPAAGTGTNGDFYIDMSTMTFYGPKASGAWPTGVGLKGPAGDPGVYQVTQAQYDALTTAQRAGKFYIIT